MSKQFCFLFLFQILWHSPQVWLQARLSCLPSSQEFCSPTSSLVKKTLKFLKANSLGEPLRVSQAVKLKAVRIFFIKIFYWVLSCLVQLQYFENWVWQCWRHRDVSAGFSNSSFFCCRVQPGLYEIQWLNMKTTRQRKFCFIG